MINNEEQTTILFHAITEAIIILQKAQAEYAGRIMAQQAEYFQLQDE